MSFRITLGRNHSRSAERGVIRSVSELAMGSHASYRVRTSIFQAVKIESVTSTEPPM